MTQTIKERIFSVLSFVVIIFCAQSQTISTAQTVDSKDTPSFDEVNKQVNAGYEKLRELEKEIEAGYALLTASLNEYGKNHDLLVKALNTADVPETSRLLQNLCIYKTAEEHCLDLVDIYQMLSETSLEMLPKIQREADACLDQASRRQSYLDSKHHLQQAIENQKSARDKLLILLKKHRESRANCFSVLADISLMDARPAAAVQAARDGFSYQFEETECGIRTAYVGALESMCMDKEMEENAKKVLSDKRISKLYKEAVLDSQIAAMERKLFKSDVASQRLILNGLTDLCQQSLQNTPTASMKVRLARYLSKAGNQVRSKRLFDDALKLLNSRKIENPEFLEELTRRDQLGSYYQECTLYYIEQNDLNMALKSLSEAEKGILTKTYAARNKLYKAHILKRHGKVNEARLEFDSIRETLLNVPALQAISASLLPDFKITDHMGERWALIVGIDQFADASIPRLRFSSKDASDVRQFLIQKAGFKTENTKLLVNQDATKRNILDTMDSKGFLQNIRPNDLVFFFISTHGSRNSKNATAANYLLAFDTRRTRSFSEGLSMQALANKLTSMVPQGHSFIMLDSCYSGALSADGIPDIESSVDVDRLLFSPRQIAVTSSSSKEKSWESQRYQNGIFTRQLLNALNEEPNYRYFRNVFDKVVLSVKSEVNADFKAKQVPRMAGLWSGVGLLSKTNSASVTRRKGSLSKPTIKRGQNQFRPGTR